MAFQWSDQAAHIQSLYPPWQASHGYREETLVAIEQKIGIQFPNVLRNFYRSWGKRDDLTRRNQSFLHPDATLLQEDALIICAENQGVWYWGILRTVLDQPDPPIAMARNEAAPLVWLPSHTRLSDFLDYLAYQHAFDGGAIHGAYSNEWVNDDLQIRIQQYGQARVLPTYPPWLVAGTAGHSWTLIVGEQYALDGLGKVAVASNTREILDHISACLRITWAYRW